MKPEIANKWNLIFDFIEKREALFFALFCAIGLIPVLLFPYFPSVDGPSHLYNARIIKELFLNSNSTLSNYFLLNSWIIPNSTGHLFLAFLHLLFPIIIAEKILIAGYLIFLPYSFRYFLKSLAYKSKLPGFLIFPFNYSFLLVFGFYNFQIGLIFLFLFIGLLTKSNFSFRLLNTFLLMLLSVLMVFSHLFVFLIACLYIFCLLIAVYCSEPKLNGWFLNLTKLTLILLPGLIITSIFLFNTETVTFKYSVPDLVERLKLIIDIQPVKAIRYGQESNVSNVLILVFVFLFIVKVISLIRIKEWKHNPEFAVLGIMTILMLFFVLFVPESLGTSVGFMSSRFVLFFFFFLIAFLAKSTFPKWVQLVSFIVLSYGFLNSTNIHFKAIKEENQAIKEILAVSEFIPENSVVLTVNQSDYWLNSHITDYLATKKMLILPQNYETSMNHFPVKTNIDSIPNLKLFQDGSLTDCKFWPFNPANPDKLFDYVVLIEGKSIVQQTCVSELKSFVKENFILINSRDNGQITLYKNPFAHTSSLK